MADGPAVVFASGVPADAADMELIRRLEKEHAQVHKIKVGQALYGIRFDAMYYTTGAVKMIVEEPRARLWWLEQALCRVAPR